MGKFGVSLGHNDILVKKQQHGAGFIESVDQRFNHSS